MTRAERLAQQEARAHAHLVAQQRRLAEVQGHLAEAQTRHREVVQKARTQRRVQVGRLAEDAGLFTLNDADLAALFQLLTPLLQTPNPVACLAGLLQDHPVLVDPALHGASLG
jgi:hypothetical protein